MTTPTENFSRAFIGIYEFKDGRKEFFRAYHSLLEASKKFGCSGQIIEYMPVSEREAQLAQIVEKIEKLSFNIEFLKDGSSNRMHNIIDEIIELAKGKK